jgi:pimeloyl-ACP methyl ester carboxylesterase
LVPAHWQATSQRVDIGGDVAYLDFGGPTDESAPRVVFVHGLGGSATNWGLVAPAIAARARTYALDLPGFGLSYPAGRSARVQANAEVVHRFVTEVVGEPAILVGNSMGGLISMM